ncbi:MAG: hypothetical protein JWM64_2436 [Frankiales bacterium]|nr:hypothetical protein [Frankiales bacterium]
MQGQAERVSPLTAFYRVTPSGNRKPRPPWFSKRLALQSFLRSLEQAGPGSSVAYVADGGVPDELRDLVRATGPVLDVVGGDAPRSFRRLLDVTRDVDPDAVVWFAEDDYLYRPEALPALREAAAHLPGADYLGLYTPDNTAWHADHASQPGRRLPEERYDVGGRTWRRSWDSTSTFGLRGAALHRDRALLAVCSATGGPWDNTCVTTMQGVPSYAWRHLYGDLYLRLSRASAGRVVSRPLLRGLTNLAAPTRGATWVAPATSLITHCEPDHLAPGTDWAGLAQELAAA